MPMAQFNTWSSIDIIFTKTCYACFDTAQPATISSSCCSSSMKAINSDSSPVCTFPCGFRVGYAQNCAPRRYGNESTVCVCNRTYCDWLEVGPLTDPVAFTSSKAGLRFERSSLVERRDRSSEEDSAEVIDLVVSVNPKVQYQSIIGFGGAMTDAAGINILSLSGGVGEKIVDSYFSEKGIGYSVIRVPMASCDFSTHEYSYDDVKGDLTLTYFALDFADLTYKIPLIQYAKSVLPPKVDLKIFGSPWSAPAWMKTSGRMSGNGTLIGQPGGKYYKAWANYFVRFLQDYANHNITFWGLTAQNEPSTGYIAGYSFQTMGFTPELQRDFIKLDLGPALASNGFANVKLMIVDDQRFLLPVWAETVLSDPDARKYVSGIAVHWYWDFLTPSAVLRYTHKRFPDHFLFASEACEGWQPWDPRKVLLGSWKRAENYAKDIIDDLNHFVTGWTDWNLALDLGGGPNWANNFVDSPIIVNASAAEFYKQPMFYAMGHFSKFLEPGAVRIAYTLTPALTDVRVTTFLSPAKDRVVAVLLNLAPVPFSITLRVNDKTVSTTLPASSIQTILWPYSQSRKYR